LRLAGAVGEATLRGAVVDVGANSVKMVIGEIDEGGDLRLLADSMRFARLGEGVSATGKLSLEAQERTLAVTEEFLKVAKRHQVEKIRLVGTSALREVENRAEFLARVRREFGIDLEVLSEKDEARLSYTAVVLDPSFKKYQGQLCVADIGGGSTELILGESRAITFWQSLRLGAVRLTEQILKSDPPNREEVAKAEKAAEAAIRSAAEGHRASRVAGVGGTVVSLARIWKGLPSAKTEEVHGVRMSNSDCRQMLDRLSSLSIAQRKTLVGLDADRADIILAGAIILEQILSILAANELLVSIRGLRHGVLYDLLGI
jgi:exopolyphosphatase/guanosine-5'-triphosphate,3'-diphosphate pyrophosphatase